MTKKPDGITTVAPTLIKSVVPARNNLSTIFASQLRVINPLEKKTRRRRRKTARAPKVRRRRRTRRFRS